MAHLIFELHADFDRDGVVRATAREHGRRLAAPGGLIVPNVDRDRRRFPARVVDGPALSLDFQQRFALRQDDEPVRLKVLAPVGVPAGRQAMFRFSGGLAPFAQLRDASGRQLRRESFGLEDTLVTLSGRETVFLLELRAFAGAPSMGTSPTSPLTELTVQFGLQQPSGAFSEFDRGLFSAPGIVLAGDLDPPERIYIVESFTTETLSRGLAPIAAKAGIPVVTSPHSLSGNDRFLRTQFLFAHCSGLSKTRRLVLHMSRSGSLDRFVQSHFPSQEIGLVEDLRLPRITLRDIRGATRTLSLTEGHGLYARMMRVWKTLTQVIDVLEHWLTEHPDAQAQNQLRLLDRREPGFVLELRRASALSAVIDRIARRLGLVPKLTAARRKRLRDEQQELKRWVREILTDFPFDGPYRLWISLSPNERYAVALEEADRLQKALREAHNLSFGDNFVVSPPVVGAPSGKVFVGHRANTLAEMAPAVRRFITAQGRQPLVDINASWISVGTVTEVLALLPSNASGFAVARPSATLAVALLEAAFAKYQSGLPAGHPMSRPLPFDPFPTGRWTHQGKHPLTMMGRGRAWYSPTLPSTFRLLSSRFADDPAALPAQERHDPIERRPRFYPAKIGVGEYLSLERGVHPELEAQYLQPIDRTLERELPDVPRLRLPVLFDVVASRPRSVWERARGLKRPRLGRTLALLPNPLTLAALGRRVIVPRANGPRMSPDDAAAVLQAVLPRYNPDLTLPRIDADRLRRRGLTRARPFLWSGPTPLGIEGLDGVIAQFRDSFPENNEDEEIVQALREANPTRFRPDGTFQRRGLQHLNLPGESVDLLDAATHLLLEAVGAEADWVDDWDGHVIRSGVGTGVQVMRRLPPR